MVAVVSFSGSRKHTQLLEQTGLDSFALIDWREFEMRVGEFGVAAHETN